VEDAQQPQRASGDEAQRGRGKIGGVVRRGAKVRNHSMLDCHDASKDTTSSTLDDAVGCHPSAFKEKAVPRGKFSCTQGTQCRDERNRGTEGDGKNKHWKCL